MFAQRPEHVEVCKSGRALLRPALNNHVKIIIIQHGRLGRDTITVLTGRKDGVERWVPDNPRCAFMAFSNHIHFASSAWWLWYLVIQSWEANANSDSLLKIYGRNMMLASECVDANCALCAASIGRAPLYPVQEWRIRCLCDDDDDDNIPSRVTSPAAAFHKLMTYGLPYAARRLPPPPPFSQISLLSFHCQSCLGFFWL